MPTQANNRKAALTKSRTTERNKKNTQTYKKNTKTNLWKYKEAYNATARNKPRTKPILKTPTAGGRRNTRRRR